ncbi:MAG: CoA transferase subunit A [Chloroflexota bacterium]|nr:CoA transferase subunit A [Chloroflexota bacterium]
MTKRMTLANAVAEYVPDDSSIVMGTCLEALIPFAAGHELIRQQRRGLSLIGPISDVLFDQLIGAGCVDTVIAAWVGNVSAGLGHCFRRAVEESIPHPLEVRDHSNFSIALALQAGALGAPFIPTRSLLGSDLPNTNPDLVESTNPLNEEGEPLILVRALRPDIAILHVQRSDEEGHAHMWGNLGISVEAALAAEKVIIVAEEIVPSDVMLSDPNRMLTHPHKVVAVVEEPGGAHPSPVQGYYDRDHEFFHEYHRQTRSVEGFQEWIGEWITGVPDRSIYLDRLGRERWQALRIEQSAPSIPVNFAYRS